MNDCPSQKGKSLVLVEEVMVFFFFLFCSVCGVCVWYGLLGVGSPPARDLEEGKVEEGYGRGNGAMWGFAWRSSTPRRRADSRGSGELCSSVTSG